MQKYLITLILGLIITTDSIAQKTTYYKDYNLYNETSEKKAKFTKTEFHKGDTLIIHTRRVSDSLLIEESKWINNKAVGIWTNFDLKRKLKTYRNFDKVKYWSKADDKVDNNTIDELADCTNCEFASYPTGDSGMYRFIINELNYPRESQENGTQGTVYIKFIIDKEGKIIPQYILRGVDYFIDLEAWNIVEKMPYWRPATKDGQAIESYFVLPLIFVLQ